MQRKEISRKASGVLIALCLSLAFNAYPGGATSKSSSSNESASKAKSSTAKMHSAKKITEKEDKSLPVFQRRKGRLSESEAKQAGIEANKFYAAAQKNEKAGKLDAAKDLYYKSAIVRSDVWGHNDPAVAKIAIKLGDIESKQNHPYAARHWYKQALKSLSKRFGPGDYELVPVLTVLAELESKQGNHEVSGSYYDHVLRLQERCLGEDNPEVSLTRIAYIEELLADKDNAEAVKIANQGIEIEKKKATPDQYLGQLQQLLSRAQAARTSNSSK